MGESWKTRGWYQKYRIERMKRSPCSCKIIGDDFYCMACGGSGEVVVPTPVNPEHTYFILHFETDPHAQEAARAYVRSVASDNPRLASDILKNLAEAIERREKEVAEEVPESSKPKVVCLCGSTKFADEYREANRRETLAGNIVLSIGVDFKTDPVVKELDPTKLADLKDEMDELHRRKIDLSDMILVINPGGYIGDSTKAEIKYAQSKGKIVLYTTVEAE